MVIFISIVLFYKVKHGIGLLVQLNSIALRKAKIVYNFGLSKCNRVKGKVIS